MDARNGNWNWAKTTIRKGFGQNLSRNGKRDFTKKWGRKIYQDPLSCELNITN